MTSAVQTRHCLFGKASRAPDVPQAIQNQYTGTFAKQEAAWRIKTSLINCIDDKTTTRLTNSFIATRANYSLAMSELGSFASFPRCTRGVRFTPDNGHTSAAFEAPSVTKVGGHR